MLGRTIVAIIAGGIEAITLVMVDRIIALFIVIAGIAIAERSQRD